MKLIRMMGVTATATTLTLALAGVAAAADSTTMNTTGPDSDNRVVIDNTTSITTTNTNVVQVTNENVQTAQTGDVSANKNTSVGGVLGSGTASNDSATTTAVAIDNAAVGGLGGSTGNNPGTVSNGGAGGSGGMSGQPVGGRGGGVLGAAVGGMGGGVLPEVGASSPVDVSALRAAWQPKTEAPTTKLVKQSQAVTTFMLIVATVLSLLGAAGSAVYTRRKERSA
jgi:hypothetical protein